MIAGGHDRPGDKRYHMDHGFPHERFARFGPGYQYNIVRIDPDHRRFWLPGGFFFDVAAWDWPHLWGLVLGLWR